MGRKKIAITRIQDERNRQITFSKRKAGLLKKAYELSILCDVEIAVIMITSNKKLYQYASSNMNSILIRYTEFKDPDESKTNADILDDITKKEKGGGQDESGEEDSAHTNFLVTPHTQESYRKIDEEFDHLLRQNQLPQQPVQGHGIQTPLGSAPASIPSVMPVSVPVSNTNTVHRQIHQHLKGQLETQKSSGSSGGPLSSASSVSLFSPQSDLSSASPAGMAGKTGQKSPMPPPANTPTRLQMIRNQTLKLHLPGSGRNYISLPGPGSSKSATDEGMIDQNDSPEDGGEEPDNKDEEAGGGGEKGSRPGAKPQLRVYIPGQKEFVPRTQATSPLAQVDLNNTAAGGGGASEAAGAGGGGGMGQAPAIANQTTTSTESLTTPILSLATPNIFSSLPPLFSSFMGDFPFGQMPGGAASAGGGGGGGGGGGASAVGGAGGGHPGGASGDSGSAALVAFPVSIQPSASGQGMGNLVLQAQNMGQPFLLTPTYDRTQHPLMNTSQGGQGGHGAPPPPSSLASAGINPSMMKDLEQLKQQYERTTQLLQQQLLFSQMTSMMHQQHQQQNQQPRSDGGGGPEGPPGGDGGTSQIGGGAGGQLEGTGSQGVGHGVGGVGSSGGPPAGASVSLSANRDRGGGLGSQESDAEAQANQFINGSDVMISSRSQSDSLLRRTARDVGELDSEDLAASKRPRLDTSVSAL